MSLLDRICTYIVQRGSGGDFAKIALSLADINERQAREEEQQREIALRAIERHVANLGTGQSAYASCGAGNSMASQAGVSLTTQMFSRGDAA